VVISGWKGRRNVMRVQRVIIAVTLHATSEQTPYAGTWHGLQSSVQMRWVKGLA